MRRRKKKEENICIPTKKERIHQVGRGIAYDGDMNIANELVKYHLKSCCCDKTVSRRDHR